MAKMVGLDFNYPKKRRWGGPIGEWGGRICSSSLPIILFFKLCAKWEEAPLLYIATPNSDNVLVQSLTHTVYALFKHTVYLKLYTSSYNYLDTHFVSGKINQFNHNPTDLNIYFHSKYQTIPSHNFHIVFFNLLDYILYFQNIKMVHN